MCSINGCVDFCTPHGIDKQRIRAAGRAMAHRGPDSHGEFFSTHVGLYHNRLSVMDPARGGQPMQATHRGKTYTIIYNGEVYNTAQADGKILVINFWAAWCSPCKSELPDFDKVAAEYKDSVTVLAIHLHDTRIDGEAYIAENFAETSILFGYDSVGDTFYYLLGGPDTIPMTLIIDENGVIVNRYETRISEQTLKEAIDAALAD